MWAKHLLNKFGKWSLSTFHRGNINEHYLCISISIFICICIRADVYTSYMVLYLHINREGNQLKSRHFDGWLSLLRANRTISKTSPSFKWKIICHGQCLLYRGLLTRLGFSFIKLPGVFQLQRLRCSEYVAGMLDTKLVMQCYLSKRKEQQMEQYQFLEGAFAQQLFSAAMLFELFLLHSESLQKCDFMW